LFRRQSKAGALCVADLFRDIANNERDVIALRVVTMGGTSEAATEGELAEDGNAYIEGSSTAPGS